MLSEISETFLKCVAFLVLIYENKTIGPAMLLQRAQKEAIYAVVGVSGIFFVYGSTLVNNKDQYCIVTYRKSWLCDA